MADKAAGREAPPRRPPPPPHAAQRQPPPPLLSLRRCCRRTEAHSQCWAIIYPVAPLRRRATSHRWLTALAPRRSHCGIWGGLGLGFKFEAQRPKAAMPGARGLQMSALASSPDTPCNSPLAHALSLPAQALGAV
jgi:hypothetical protein